MSTVFTMPGKMGDSLLQWPVAFHYGQQVGDFEVWMDEGSCKPLVPLFEAQPHVTKVKLIGGIDNYNCGGQPFHFELPTSAFEGNTIYHLGLRSFPQRQISLETLTNSKVPVKVPVELFAETPSIVTAGSEKKNRLVLHGQGVCPHNRQTPTFWKFIAGIRKELETTFDEIVFVGSPRDLEVAQNTYPLWKTFSDDGNFRVLADYLSGSRAMIGCGSGPITLAGAMKLPSIRVHDPIGDGKGAPKVIWDNLGDNQLNDTEVGLRKSWAVWRDKWLLH